ncbi:uncharacterized protein LOC119072018 [Bradysia coprophila]|uniref:uncharacterized protein LOC119072018 n=1 Tax=Bradysia coprophila TaxID=38358 RepID=UPI00187DB55E|nr:uncharacterized protein LOC119072018 [Bradysia coprophila]
MGSFGQSVWLLFLWSNVTESSANVLLAPLRISTRHFAPYMYQNTDGNFYDGMEFQFLQRMAETLNVRLHFQAASNHSDICNDVAMNIADICIGGIFPTEDTLKYALMSVTYASDDLTWCVQKARTMPMFLAHMRYVQPAVWFMGIFGCGYPVGLLIYLLVQFDPKYKQRSSIDWHRSMLITIPAFIGLSPNFTPLKGTLRIFYATVLISAFFAFQILLTRGYDVLHKQVPLHQVSSLNEIMEKDFHLVGSLESLNLLSRNKMIRNRKIESFYICEDIDECLVPNLENLAVAGSRQNMINSPSYSPLQMFCLERLENIASYPIALYMRKDFPLAAKVDTIARQLLEAGFFVRWESWCS